MLRDKTYQWLTAAACRSRLCFAGNEYPRRIHANELNAPNMKVVLNASSVQLRLWNSVLKKNNSIVGNIWCLLVDLFDMDLVNSNTVEPL